MFYTYAVTYCLTASSCCTIVHCTILCYAMLYYCILFQLMLSYTILPFTPLYPLSYLYFTPLTTLNLFTPPIHPPSPLRDIDATCLQQYECCLSLGNLVSHGPTEQDKLAGEKWVVYAWVVSYCVISLHLSSFLPSILLALHRIV